MQVLSDQKIGIGLVDLHGTNIAVLSDPNPLKRRTGACVMVLVVGNEACLRLSFKHK